MATPHEGHWSAASWELNRFQAYHGCTVVGLNPMHRLNYATLSSFLSLSTDSYQAIQDVKIIILKTVLDWCRCFKSPSEAGSLCEFTKVYHSGGSTDLRPLISSLCSQTHNDPHLSGNVKLVSVTTTECGFRWSRRKRTMTPRGDILPARQWIYTPWPDEGAIIKGQNLIQKLYLKHNRSDWGVVMHLT